MKIKQIVKKYDDIPEKDQNYILRNCLNLSDADILFNKELSNKEISKFNKVIKKVKKRIPLQYIIGKVSFYNYEFNVKKGVLIPRFETEHLVKYMVEYINEYFKNANILDLGCGSGIIGITLKKEINNINVTCTDINKKALKLTKLNSKQLQANIIILKKNLLNKNKNKYDVIISNPPYISYNENIEKIVYDNEPHNALFAKNEGLYFYEKIIQQSKNNLNKKNIIAFEIGMNQSKKIVKIAKKEYPKAKIIIKKDLNNFDRYIFIFNNINKK